MIQHPVIVTLVSDGAPMDVFAIITKTISPSTENVSPAPRYLLLPLLVVHHLAIVLKDFHGITLMDASVINQRTLSPTTSNAKPAAR